MTWKLVTMWPSVSHTKPLPEPAGTSTVRREYASTPRTRVLMFTTEGLAVSNSSTVWRSCGSSSVGVAGARIRPRPGRLAAPGCSRCDTARAEPAPRASRMTTVRGSRGIGGNLRKETVSDASLVRPTRPFRFAAPEACAAHSQRRSSMVGRPAVFFTRESPLPEGVAPECRPKALAWLCWESSSVRSPGRFSAGGLHP